MFLQKERQNGTGWEGNEVQQGGCQMGQAGSWEERAEFLVDFFGDCVSQVGIKLLEVFRIQAAGHPWEERTPPVEQRWGWE